MSEMRDYQKKMLNSEKRIVLCNWDRKTGKSTAVMNKINSIPIWANILLIGYYELGIKLDNVDVINSIDINKIRGKRYDYIFIDDAVFSLSELGELLETTPDVKHIYIMFTNNDIEYIENTTDINKFVDSSIKKLSSEFSIINGNEKNTITREKLLDMILKLQEIKSNK